MSTRRRSLVVINRNKDKAKRNQKLPTFCDNIEPLNKLTEKLANTVKMALQR